MEYITVEKNNSVHYDLLTKLMVEYVTETDLHQNTFTPKDIIPKVTKSMIDKLDENRFLQIVCIDSEAVGFCYAKVDRATDKGVVHPGWGYIMEFFVRKTYRRNGIGKKLVGLCEQFFINNDVNKIWLTADAVTGIPFWIACNYSDTNEISTENNQKIFTKTLV